MVRKLIEEVELLKSLVPKEVSSSVTSGDKLTLEGVPQDEAQGTSTPQGGAKQVDPGLAKFLLLTRVKLKLCQQVWCIHHLFRYHLQDLLQQLRVMAKLEDMADLLLETLSGLLGRIHLSTRNLQLLLMDKRWHLYEDISLSQPMRPKVQLCKRTLMTALTLL